jgi:hypothetical protein
VPLNHWSGQASVLSDLLPYLTYLFARSLLIALMMGAVSTFEMSVNFYHTTRRSNPEDSHLQEYVSFPTPSKLFLLS